jgi:FxLD family lantipeptide
MAHNLPGAPGPARNMTVPDEEFMLDVRVVEASQPVSGLLRSTSDNCGSSCSGTACTSFVDYPA